MALRGKTYVKNKEETVQCMVVGIITICLSTFVPTTRGPYHAYLTIDK
jgi:hypothetical protein